MRCFELFIQNEKLTAQDWERLLEKIRKYDKKLILELVFDENTLEFYLYAQKNLSLLATKLEGFLLKPSDRQVDKNFATYKQLTLKLPPNKNILEYRETEEIKRDRQI